MNRDEVLGTVEPINTIVFTAPLRITGIVLPNGKVNPVGGEKT